LVSGFGCSAIKYDCITEDTGFGSFPLLLKFYEDNGIISGTAAECGGARQQYTYACIKHQCMGGPDPGPPPSEANGEPVFPKSYHKHKQLPKLYNITTTPSMPKLYNITTTSSIVV